VLWNQGRVYSEYYLSSIIKRKHIDWLFLMSFSQLRISKIRLDRLFVEVDFNNAISSQMSELEEKASEDGALSNFIRMTSNTSYSLSRACCFENWNILIVLKNEYEFYGNI